MVEDADKYDAAWAAVREAAGVVIPGGFGLRGVEGKIAAAKYCRESKTPFLGICLGMQVCPHAAALSTDLLKSSVNLLISPNAAACHLVLVHL